MAGDDGTDHVKPYKLYFVHVSGQHHSFAMVDTGRRTRITSWSESEVSTVSAGL
jgi:hypothetical protein